MLYLDHAATTPLRPEARAAMAPYLAGDFGNPSGLHAISRHARNALEGARDEVAELIGAARSSEIVFTGGGTEADNLAVLGRALRTRGSVVTTAVEHEAVLAAAQYAARIGCDVHIAEVDEQGRVDPASVAAQCGPDTAIVSVMAANNETGVRQPVPDVVAALRSLDFSAPVHTDAVQAVISEPLDVAALGADLVSIAAHKFGGPKGVGALYIRDGIELDPVVHGGGQELGRRSGTHNVAGIVGMAAALRATVAGRAGFCESVAFERDTFEATLAAAIPDVEFTAEPGIRLVQHSHFRVPGIDAETLLIRLDAAGIAASAGSACHSGAMEISHVLAAMGRTPQEAREAVRVTFGWTTVPGDGKRAADELAAIVESLR